MIDLSIIVPVYNVEKYIRSCIESIFMQSLDDANFEVIIVNDGTQDKSMEVIADILEQHRNITIINQENQGLSVALNNGLAIAKGEYVYMLDSDDLLIEGRLKLPLETALNTKTDIVIADFLQMNDDEIVKFVSNQPHSYQTEVRIEETSGIKLLDESLCRYYWRNLYKKSFLETNNISFIPGITTQDVAFTNECLLKAKRCVRINLTMIIYRCGHVSTTFSTYTLKKAKDLCVSIASIWKLSEMPSLASSTRVRQKDIVFRYFQSFTWKITYGHIKGFSQMIQAMDYMKSLAPDMRFNNGLKQKLYSLLYQKAPHTLVWLKYCHTIIRKKLAVH